MSAISDWQKGQLGELCRIEIGGTPSRNNPDYWDDEKNSNNIWVSIKDLNRKIIKSTSENISDIGVIRSNVKLQNPGTVLLSFKLSIGRVAIAGLPLYTNEAIAGLQSDKLDHEFLYQGLQQWDLLQNVDQAIKGATLNKAKLRKIAFEYPILKPEQSKIAEVLSTVDKAIEQTEEMIAKEQRIKTGLMQDLLTKGIDEDGNLRSEETHEFKDSPLGMIPVEWEVHSFGECEYFNLATGGTPSTKRNEYWNGGTIPWLSSGEIHKKIIYDADTYISELGYKCSNARYYPVNSILIALAGQGKTRGTVAINEINVTSNQSIAAFLPNKELVSPYYVYYYLDSKYDYLRSVSSGAGRAGLSLKVLASLNIALPNCLWEQNLIANKFKTLDEFILKNTCRLKKYNSQKTALMQDLLTGKVRVTPLLNSDHEYNPDENQDSNPEGARA